jgi:diguanylate cyclase (GGDEF)-like protein
MAFGLKPEEDLSEQDERELVAQHNGALAQILPLGGAFFGAIVILFTVWDYWIAPAQVALTAPVRIALVLVGSIAYHQHRLRWTPVQRCGFIYGTHASAMIIAAALIPNGLLLGLAAITSLVFLVSLAALRLSTFLLFLLTPSLFLLFLGAASMPIYGLINTLFLYVVSVAIAAAIMMAVANFRRRAFLFEKRLIHNTRHDSLTEVPNRGYVNELGLHEAALAKRYKRPLAVAMIDIDHFKRINDIYGHATGDNVLRQLAGACVANLRQADLFGRYGGEEFVCIMPETGSEEAVACIERMRSKVEAMQIQTARGPLKFTFSAGVAVTQPEIDEWEALLNDADTAMYLAKGGGRNRTVLAQARAQGETAS